MAQNEIVARLERLGQVCYKGKEVRASGEAVIFFTLQPTASHTGDLNQIVEETLNMIGNIVHSSVKDTTLRLVVSFPSTDDVARATRSWTFRFTSMLENIAREHLPATSGEVPGTHVVEGRHSRPRSRRQPKPNRALSMR